MIKAGRPKSAVPSAARRDWRPKFAALMRAKRGYPVSRKQRGFTLVELLVVIAIIAILAAILTVAVGAAIRFVTSFTVAMEIKELEMALTQYKSQYGSYPPGIGSVPASADAATSTYYAGQFKRHIDTAFRNHREGDAFTGVDPLADASSSVAPNATIFNLDASESLPFFLGGAAQFSGNIIGLKKDPVRPLTGSAAGTAVSFYTFKPEQLVDLDGDGFPSYIPQRAEGQTPFVYFGYQGYQDTLPSPAPSTSPDLAMPTQLLMWPPDYGASSGTPGDYKAWITDNYDPGVIRPVRSGTSDGLTNDWYNEQNGYQLLSAGLDGFYGSDGFLDDGTTPDTYLRDLAAPEDKTSYRAVADGVWLNMSKEDEDNVANFTEGQTFGEVGME